MPKVKRASAAPDLEHELRGLLAHDHVQVKPYGRHLLIQIEHEGEADTVARLTELDRNTYGAAFRTHTGRWEPLPGIGPRKEMAKLVTTLLGPYLQPVIY